jgi:hypothetical protein
MALILSRFALMPVMETKHSSTLPLIIPNTHLSGLSLSQTSHILAKVSSKSEI